LSSRARCLSSFVADHEPPNVVGEAPFHAAHCLVVGFAGRDLGVVVGPSASYLGERDYLQSAVELPVTTKRQAMTDSVCAGNLDWGDVGVASEDRGGGESADTPCPAQQPAGDDRPNTVDLDQVAAGRGEQSTSCTMTGGPLLGSEV
jgi:hypothetical protein